MARFINGSAVACPTLPTPGEGRARDSSVSLSNDAGLRWSVPGVPFTFYEPERPPLLRHLSPQYVDVASPRPLTISLLGGNFAPTGGALQCGFGVGGTFVDVAASFVSGGVVRCEAPRSSLSNLVVHARHDGATWSAEGLNLLVYNSSRPSLIRRVFPDAVALGHKANLSIVGANFFPAAQPRCRFAGYTAADAALFSAATSAASLARDGTMRTSNPTPTPVPLTPNP